jgi:2-succinyl-6-hydroxy-2,4-cyclohexadiene-1-carboxylate synthase
MGTGGDWSAVAARLAGAADVLAPDLPGHGAAVGLVDAAYTMDGAADRLLDALDAHDVERAVVAGYSMGGRLALHLAVRHPERVRALVLVSASPGLATDAERTARRALDAQRAAEIAADFPGFLDRWYRAAIWGGLDDGLRQRLAARRLANDPAELARSLAGMGTGAQPSHGDALGDLPPTLALAGARDAKFVQVARRMAQAPPVEAVVVPGAGHALLDEAPDAVAAAVRRALGSPDRGPA